jgi:hypothetical protein
MAAPGGEKGFDAAAQSPLAAIGSKDAIGNGTADEPEPEQEQGQGQEQEQGDDIGSNDITLPSLQERARVNWARLGPKLLARMLAQAAAAREASDDAGTDSVGRDTPTGFEGGQDGEGGEDGDASEAAGDDSVAAMMGPPAAETEGGGGSGGAGSAAPSAGWSLRTRKVLLCVAGGVLACACGALAARSLRGRGLQLALRGRA